MASLVEIYSIVPPTVTGRFDTNFATEKVRLSIKLAHLKGHGNEADFLGFLRKSISHEFLTQYLSSRSAS